MHSSSLLVSNVLPPSFFLHFMLYLEEYDYGVSYDLDH